MSKTPKYGLNITAPSDEAVLFKNWRAAIDGTDVESNMMKIDTALGDLAENVVYTSDGDITEPVPLDAALLDGKTRQSIIDEVLTFDVVIRTQSEFEALIASPTWLDAVSVCFIGDGGTLRFTIPNGIRIPQTVKRIQGINAAIIDITGGDLPGLSYQSTMSGNNYWIDGITVNKQNIGSIQSSNCGFRHCVNLTNCAGTGHNSGFMNCAVLTNCEGTGTDPLSGHGFTSCQQLSNCLSANSGFYACNRLMNCTSDSPGTNMNGFSICSDLDNCTALHLDKGGIGFNGCTRLNNCYCNELCRHAFADSTQLTNCTGKGDIGFYYCVQLSNCKGAGTGTDSIIEGYGFSDCSRLSGCTRFLTSARGIFYQCEYMDSETNEGVVSPLVASKADVNLSNVDIADFKSKAKSSGVIGVDYEGTLRIAGNRLAIDSDTIPNGTTWKINFTDTDWAPGIGIEVIGKNNVYLGKYPFDDVAPRYSWGNIVFSNGRFHLQNKHPNFLGYYSYKNPTATSHLTEFCNLPIYNGYCAPSGGSMLVADSTQIYEYLHGHNSEDRFYKTLKYTMPSVTSGIISTKSTKYISFSDGQRFNLSTLKITQGFSVEKFDKTKTRAFKSSCIEAGANSEFRMEYFNETSDAVFTKSLRTGKAGVIAICGHTSDFIYYTVYFAGDNKQQLYKIGISDVGFIGDEIILQEWADLIRTLLYFNPTKNKILFLSASITPGSPKRFNLYDIATEAFASTTPAAGTYSDYWLISCKKDSAYIAAQNGQTSNILYIFEYLYNTNLCGSAVSLPGVFNLSKLFTSSSIIMNESNSFFDLIYYKDESMDLQRSFVYSLSERGTLSSAMSSPSFLPFLSSDSTTSAKREPVIGQFFHYPLCGTNMETAVAATVGYIPTYEV